MSGDVSGQPNVVRDGYCTMEICVQYRPKVLKLCLVYFSQHGKWSIKYRFVYCHYVEVHRHINAAFA